MFIYFQRFEAAGQQAFELSRHVPDYLPERFWSTTVSAAHNMILAVGGNEPSNQIFCYRNQVQGDQIVQNAFFTFTLDSETLIQSINCIEDDVFIITQEVGTDNQPFVEIQKMSLIPENLKNFAQISFEATFIGQGHYFQIWEPDSALKKQKESRDRLVKEKKSLSTILIGNKT